MNIIFLTKNSHHYNYDQNGITANIKKYSKRWWIRRSEAFSLLENYNEKKKILFFKLVLIIILQFFNSFL